MLTVDERQIRELVEGFQRSEASKIKVPFNLIGDGESLEFYRGVITGLLISHTFLLRAAPEQKDLTRWLAWSAARTAEKYQNTSDAEDETFTQIMGVM